MKKYRDRIKEAMREVALVRYNAIDIIKEMVEDVPSKEIIISTKDDIYNDPEKTLCIPVKPTGEDEPVPGYVYGVKKIGKDIKLMVMYSNGDTDEVDQSLDVYDCLFIAEQINNKIEERKL